MKRLATALAALMALPLLAAESKDLNQPATKVAESPLVQAAKKNNRGKSKTIVITNATVKTSKGHLTVSANSSMPVIPPPAPSAEVKELEARAKARVEAAKQAALAQEKEKRRQEEMSLKAAMYEAGDYGEDANEPLPPPAPAPRP